MTGGLCAVEMKPVRTHRTTDQSVGGGDKFNQNDPERLNSGPTQPQCQSFCENQRQNTYALQSLQPFTTRNKASHLSHPAAYQHKLFRTQARRLRDTGEREASNL